MKPLKDDLTEMNMDPELLERKPMLDGLTENLDGVWVIGFNRKNGKPFASGHFLDPVCSDALSFGRAQLQIGWRSKLTSTYKRDEFIYKYGTKGKGGECSPFMLLDDTDCMVFP